MKYIPNITTVYTKHSDIIDHANYYKLKQTMYNNYECN